MQETEVKFRVKDFTGIRSKLKALGAHLVWKGMEENIFFDTKSRNLYKRQAILRLRRWNDHSVVLTVKTSPKNKNKKYKIKQEYQVEVSDFAMVQKMLEALGFIRDFQYKKFREHWKIGNAFVELDMIGRLHFVEIESDKADINMLAGKLGLEWKQAERRGYVKILKDFYKKK